MEKLYHKFIQLPSKQLKWLMFYKKLFAKPLRTNNDYSFIFELIERKAYYNGYLDLIVILNTKGFEKCFLSNFHPNNKYIL